MIHENKPIYGKIMLFGEYSVILGSKALVIPLKRFSGQWTRNEAGTEREHMLQTELSRFAAHLAVDASASAILDTKKLSEALGQGWWLDANIPIGYGAGSSGGVVAALYEQFAWQRPQGLPELKKQLSALENYFHGNSSGLDPLCCISRQPVLVEEMENIQLLPPLKIPEGLSIFLFDSETVGMTGPLVKHFNEKMKDYKFYKTVSREWIPAVNEAIDQFLQLETDRFLGQLEQISQFERQHMQPMIPEEVAALWDIGLISGDFTMKLCGSGGGGFSLVFGLNAEKVRYHFPSDRLIAFS